MNNLNSILVEGNLTRDPEYRETPRGTAVCTFGVASNRFYRQDEELQKEVSFFDVEAWARNAERCRENLHKGRGVRVAGRLKQDRWTDDDGNRKSRVKIVAEHVEFRPPPRKPAESEAGAEETVVEGSGNGAGEPAEGVAEEKKAEALAVPF